MMRGRGAFGHPRAQTTQRGKKDILDDVVDEIARGMSRWRTNA